MKTTLEIEDELLRQAKAEAARAGLSLKLLVDEALRARLMAAPATTGPFQLRVPMVSGTAPPAVDVADRDALYDLMERG